MGWLVRERRGPSWKDQTLDSISLPPFPLVVFFGLFMMLMYFATYSKFVKRVERSKMELKFGLFLLPVVGILVVTVMMILRRRLRRYTSSGRRPVYDAAAEDGSSPWGLMLVLVVLLVMVYYQASFQSALFRGI